MKNFTYVLAATLALALSGCGGSGGGAPGDATGVWSGSFSAPNDVNGTLDLDLQTTAGNINGTARVIVGGVVHIGTVAGTVVGSTAQFSAVYDGGYGSANYTGSISGGNAMAGTYARGSESGTFTVNLVAASTRNIDGSWAGTYISTGGGVNGNVAFTFTQNGNLLTGTAIVANTNGTFNGNITGQIFGNNARFGGTIGAYGDVTYTGTTTDSINMSGTFTGSDMGTFTMTHANRPGKRGSLKPPKGYN